MKTEDRRTRSEHRELKKEKRKRNGENHKIKVKQESQFQTKYTKRDGITKRGTQETVGLLGLDDVAMDKMSFER